jgi:predicted nucleotidyltransferase
LSELLGRRVDLNTFRALSRYYRSSALSEARDVYVAA